MGPCLPPAGWRAFARGGLFAGEAAAAEAHLLACPACLRAFLGELRGADTIASPMRDAPPENTEGPATGAARYQPVLDAQGNEVELGRGGIGRVLLATDLQLGRDVAVKQLLPGQVHGADPASTAGLVARFLREARVTGQLEHPAIVPVYELGQQPDGSYFYVMRRLRGRTLAEAAQAAASLEARLALLPHVLAACQAVAFAHSRAVVHRDLKPQNVMVDRFGETWVVDWGLARVRGQDADEQDADEQDAPSGPELATPQHSAVRLAPDLTRGTPHAVVGTPAYMAPEQLAGRIAEVDERSDVWGLGAILYEVVSGQAPRQAVRPPASTGWALSAVRPLQEVAPAAPRELAAICARAMHDDAAARYPTAAELAADLDAFVHGRRVQAYEYRAVDLLRRYGRRFRVPLAVGAVALVLLLALGVRSWWQVQAERNDARQLADLLLGDVSRQLQPVPGSLPLLEAITGPALAFYERVGRDEGLAPEARARMALALVRLATLHRKLGRFDEALRVAASAQALADAEPAAARAHLPLYAAGVDSLVATATVHHSRGESAAFRRVIGEAQARVDAAPPAWDDEAWLLTRSMVASRQALEAYQRDDMATAVVAARRAVALDEQRLARQPGAREVLRSLATALLDAQLPTFYSEAPDAAEEALRLGARSIGLLEGLPDLPTDLDALSTLAGAHRQQHQLLLAVGRIEDAAAQLQAARARYEQLYRLEPEALATLGDLGSVLLQTGEAERARELLGRALARGAGGDYVQSFVLAALLSGHLDEVLARRAALEAGSSHQGLWVLAVALAARGAPRDAARAVRLAAAAPVPQTEWPAGAVQRFARGVGGPAGAAIARFADAYEVDLLKQVDDAVWRAHFEAFAVELEALAPSLTDGGEVAPR